MKTAVLAGGCFWGLEELIRALPGVTDTEVGYTGGANENPTYETHPGHAEAVRITYDPNVITYRELLDFFFRVHNPTTLNQQGNDVGTQYRSVIFYHDNQQEAAARDMIRKLTEEGIYDSTIVTEVSPASPFYEAEDYHHNYFNRNPGQPYCAAVIRPKLQKFLSSYGR